MVFFKTRAPFLKNTIFQYGLQIAKYLFPFITIPYLTRVLGPDIFAIRAYILAAMTFMQVFLDYGFHAYGVRAVALANAEGNQKEMRATIGAVMVSRGILSAVGALVLIPIAVCIPIMAANPMYVAIAYICVCFKALLPDFVFTGLEDMGIITYRFVVAQAVSTVLVFVLVHSAGDLLWVPALETLAALIAFMWSWINVLWGRKLKPVFPGAQRLRLTFVKSTVFFLSNAATTIFTCLTTLMIGVLIVDVAEVSYWSLAMTAVAAVQSLYTPITNSLYPHMCKNKDFRLFRNLLIAGTLAVLVGTIAFAVLSDTVMWVLGGEEYLDGSWIIAAVSPVLLFSYPAMLMGFPVLAAVGRDKQLTLSSVASGLFHITGLLVLAAGGWFTVANVAALRCCTEFALMAVRGVFAWRYCFADRWGKNES